MYPWCTKNSHHVQVQPEFKTDNTVCRFSNWLQTVRGQTRISQVKAAHVQNYRTWKKIHQCIQTALRHIQLAIGASDTSLSEIILMDSGPTFTSMSIIERSGTNESDRRCGYGFAA